MKILDVFIINYYPYPNTSPFDPDLLVGYDNNAIKYSNHNKEYLIGYGTYNG